MLGARLSDLRKTSGKTQEEMAAYLGISRPAYTAYESGRRQPDYAMLQRIADYHRVTIDFLLGRPDVFGLFVATKRAECHKTITKLAEDAGLSDRLLTDIESGIKHAADLSPSELDRLAAALNLTTMDLILCRDQWSYAKISVKDGEPTSGQYSGRSSIHDPSGMPYGSGGLVRVPILAKIRIGEPIYTDQEIIGYEWLNREDAPQGDVFYLHAGDDALLGSRIRAGDLVLISQSHEVEDGEIVLALVDEDKVLIRRIYVRDGISILQADNSLYPPVVSTVERTRVLGRVKGVKFRV